eukprot:446412_1
MMFFSQSRTSSVGSSGCNGGGCAFICMTIVVIFLWIYFGISFTIDGIQELKEISEIKADQRSEDITIHDCYIFDVIKKDNGTCHQFTYYAISYETCGNESLISASYECYSSEDNYIPHSINDTISCYINDCTDEIFTDDEYVEQINIGRKQINARIALGIGLGLLSTFVLICICIGCVKYCKCCNCDD